MKNNNLSVKVPPANMKNMKAVRPPRSSSGVSRKSSKSKSVSRKKSTRTGNVSPLSCPSSPVNPKRDSLSWALSKSKTPPPNMERGGLRKSQLMDFQSAQGQPSNIAFKPASSEAVPHIPPTSHKDSIHTQFPSGASMKSSKHGRSHNNPRSEEVWEDISLHGSANPSHPQRPSKATTRPRPRNNHEVFRKQGITEAGGKRAIKGRQNPDFDFPHTRPTAKWWQIVAGLVLVAVIIGIGIAVATAGNKHSSE